MTSVRLLSVGRLRRSDAPAEARKCELREGCGFFCGGRLRHVRGRAPRSPSGNGYSATQILLSPVRCKRCEVSNTSDQAPVRSHCNCHGDVSARRAACSRAVTVQLCKLCWQEGAARCRTCTHWEDSQGRLSSPLRNTHCTLHAHQSPADSRRALETRAGHRAAALQCRTKADHEWRSPCWPLFSSTHSTACSSPSPIAHRPSPIAHRPSPIAALLLYYCCR